MSEDEDLSDGGDPVAERLVIARRCLLALGDNLTSPRSPTKEFSSRPTTRGASHGGAFPSTNSLEL